MGWDEAKPLSYYVPGAIITVNDKMQKVYIYTLTARVGDFSDYPEFKPFATPFEILELGAFEGKYLNDCFGELPFEWYFPATMKAVADYRINYFHIKSRSSLGVWREKKWIGFIAEDKDVRGWFQWYCRFYLGRRDKNVDAHQIKRWKSFKRHFGAVVKNCCEGGDSNDPSTYGNWDNPGNLECRPKQRQALLQWAWNFLA